MITWKEAVRGRLIEQELEHKRQKSARKVETVRRETREAEAINAFRRSVETEAGYALPINASILVEERSNKREYNVSVAFSPQAEVLSHFTFNARENQLSGPGWKAYRSNEAGEILHARDFGTLLDAAIWALDLKLEDFND